MSPLVIFGILLCLVIIALCLVVWLILRSAPDIAQESIVPTELLKYLKTQSNTYNILRGSVDKQLTSSKENQTATINKIESAFEIFRTQLDQKDVELKRLKSGYDYDVFRNFLARFIRVHTELFKECEAATDSDAHETLSDIRDLFEDSLSECGVRIATVSVGDTYNPELLSAQLSYVATSKKEDDGKVSRIVHPAYYHISDTGDTLLKEARLKIYRFETKGAENG